LESTNGKDFPEVRNKRPVVVMDLLDFPPEIFRRIIHCLVSDTGVVESWKLRRVCRMIPISAVAYVLSADFLGTFDQEISENILAIQRLCVYILIIII
jgi:hypothetical protein